MIYLAYATAWLSTAAATIAGMYFTHSPWCLWALILPAKMEIKHQKKDDSIENKNQDSEDGEKCGKIQE